MSTAAVAGRKPAAPQPGEPIRLYQDGKGRWRYRVTVDGPRKPDGKRQQITRVRDTLRLARAAVTEIRSEVARGEYRPKVGTTVSELADEWLAAKRGGRARPITIKGYSDVLLSVRQRIGHKPVQDLTVADVERLRDWLRTEGGQRHRGLSVRSTCYALTALQAVMARAVTLHLVPENVVQAVERPDDNEAEEVELERWTVAQLLTFRTVADQDPWAGAWRLSLSGLRRSEVCGLRWSDVDWEAGTVRVQQSRVVVGKGTQTGKPKSKASNRTVRVERLHPGTMALLRRLRLASVSSADGDLILLDAAGQPVYPGAVSDRFGELCREAGVPVIHLHSVRHSLAYLLHDSGVTPAEASSMLGHTIAVHLKTYLFAREDAADTAADRLGQALAGGGAS